VAQAQSLKHGGQSTPPPHVLIRSPTVAGGTASRDRQGSRSISHLDKAEATSPSLSATLTTRECENASKKAASSERIGDETARRHHGLVSYMKMHCCVGIGRVGCTLDDSGEDLIRRHWGSSHATAFGGLAL
jgi:hypothetical protein